MNGRDKVERIPQTSQPEEAGNSEILDEASQVARGVLESIQALAGTTLVKGVQIHQLHKYAVSKGWLLSDVSRLGTYSDRGSENEIYMSFDNRFVYKLNDFRYADDNLTPFFERIYAHNILFKECAYQLCGFAYNQGREVLRTVASAFYFGGKGGDTRGNRRGIGQNGILLHARGGILH